MFHAKRREVPDWMLSLFLFYAMRQQQASSRFQPTRRSYTCALKKVSSLVVRRPWMGEVEEEEPEEEEEEGPEDEPEEEAVTVLVMLEHQDLQEAMLRSKAEGPPPINTDDVVIFRLTRTCNEVRRALAEAPALVDARSRVEQAECTLFHDVAQGACSLVPMTKELLLELQLQLKKYHVVALRSDRTAILAALKQVPDHKRPKVRDDHRAATLVKESPTSEAETAPGPPRPPVLTSSKRSSC
mmetsp:Transcript_79108/g.156685  ORF Transcript_79108/g.156685 Transcript_79108/m.156685 type:complete len:242 (-) Transcript_79108:172-897(-)